MTASRTVETHDQPVQTGRRVSAFNSYPLLGLALIVKTAAAFYGALFYFFILD